MVWLARSAKPSRFLQEMIERPWMLPSLRSEVTQFELDRELEQV